MEVELKLLLDPAENENLLRHPLIAAHARAPLRSEQLTARYFDTPDLHLLRHGAGLRVRKMNGQWIQTMKAGGGVRSGLHARNEWEGLVPRPWPQLGKLRKLVGADAVWNAVLAESDLKQRLEPLFAVQVERSTWDLDFDGSEIELVLDHGMLEHHTSSAPVNEIELELKGGRAASLFAFALELLDTLPLHLSNSSKAERGYALFRQTGMAAAKAAPLQLAPDATMGEALLAVLGNCLDQIQANEQAVIHTDDTESLHQMRVGVRRLRCALKLFAPCAPCPAGLEQDIAWLADELGAARDWDVLAGATLARVKSAPEAGESLIGLQCIVRDEARDRRRLAALALRSQRYTRLQLELGLWMQGLARAETDAPARANPLARPAAAYAGQALERLHRKMRKRAARVDHADPRTVHRLRIAGKRCRYALEFFQPLFRAKDARRYLAQLAAMQEQLGGHNDLVTADALLRQVQPQREADAAAGLAFARGYLLALRGRDSNALLKVRRVVKTMEPPALA